MIYSIGSKAKLHELNWSSDWDSTDILGEDYPHDFVVGLYSEKELIEGYDVSYYIDLRDCTVIAIFLDIEEDEEVNVETIIWNERYFV